MKMKKIGLFIATLAACLIGGVALTGCMPGQKSAASLPPEKKIQIVCTNFPSYDFAKHIVKNHGEVTMLVKPGTDIHSFSPSPKDLKAVADSDLLIYTGGTIGMNRNPHTGALEPFDFEHLLINVPELNQFDTHIATYQFNPPIDSSDMSPKLWTELAHIIAKNYNDFDGFVILHGTDTMAYTASALSYMLENLTKPVILTGSQLPIGQLRTDGKENLITSIECCR